MRVKSSLLVWYFYFIPLALTSSSSTPDISCCLRKVISAPAQYEGTYTFKRKFDGAKNSECADACIYSKDGSTEEFCFKAVNSGAATIDDQCDASSPGPSMTGMSSPGTSPPGTSPPGTSPSGTSPPGSSPPGQSSTGGSTSAGSTLDPASQIEKSNQEIAKKNQEISAKITQRKAASDASLQV